MLSGKWNAFTNLIYYSPRGDSAASFLQLLSSVTMDSVLTAEDDVRAASVKRIDVNVKLRGRQAVVELDQKTFLFEAASVAQLLAKTSLFVFDTPNCYSEFMQPSSRRPHVRAVTSNETIALKKAYCNLNPVPELFYEVFPDSCLSDGKLKYGYVLITDSIALRSGSYSKHWLLQVKQLLNRPASASHIRKSDFCKWAACLTVLKPSKVLIPKPTDETTSRGSVSVNRSAARKVKKWGTEPKKTLAPLRKKRSDPENTWEYCAHHTGVRKASKSTLLSGPDDELWKCVQARINWQKELASKSLFGMLASGDIKQHLNKYFKKCKRYLARVVPAETAITEVVPPTQGNRLQDDDQLAEMREEKHLELLVTHELKQLAQVEVPVHFVRHQLGAALAQALYQPTLQKYELIKALRQRLERMATDSLSNSYSDLWDSSSVKQSSRPNTSSKQSDSGKQEPYKRKEEVNRRMLTSPYFEVQVKPKSRHFKKLPLPDSLGNIPKNPSRPQGPNRN